MTTALAAQLKQLASITGANVGKRPRGRPSLLYSYQEAADIGTEAIYAIGLQGFEQLCRLDARFQPFGSTLFSQASLAYVREQQTAEANARLDASVLAFCQLLSSYFLLQPAFKALEYLVRHYKVNEHNADALMHAALPYHSTNEFVRLVQVLRLEGSKLWGFLAPMQSSGAAMPREVLVQRCINDRSLLRFVCEMAQQLSAPKRAGRVAMSFYAVVLCEVLATAKTVNEQLVTMLLPYLVKGLGLEGVSDYRAATQMIITQLASRVVMSGELVAALVSELCRGAAAGSGLQQTLLVLAHLAVTQACWSTFPDRALRQLAKAAGVAGELAALAERGTRLAPLMGLLLKAAAAQALQHSGCERLLEETITLVPLGSAAETLARTLLAQGAAEDLAEPARSTLLCLLRALELRYPLALDAAVNAALSSVSAPAESGAAGGAGAGAASLDMPARERLFMLLDAAFAGTARSPLLEAGTTLALAVDAPSAAVREMALQKLANLSLAADNEFTGAGEMAAFVQSVVLRRVQDDVPAVALAALRVGALAQAPPEPLLDALAACYHKAIQQALHPGAKKSARKEARELAKEALAQLSGPFSTANPALKDQVALLLLDALPVAPTTRKLAGPVLKCAAAAEHPLLRGLADVKPAAAAAAQRTLAKGSSKAVVKNRKGEKGGQEGQPQSAAEGAGVHEAADLAHNRSVLAELARHVASDSEAQAALLRMLPLALARQRELSRDEAPGRRGLLLLLAAANVALRQEGGAGMAGSLLGLLLAQPLLPPSRQAAWPAFSAEGLVTDESLPSLADGSLSQRALCSELLLTALEVVPARWLAQQGQQGLAALFASLCQRLGEKAGRQLEALVKRAAEVVPASELLSGIFALTPETAPSAEVQAAALRSFTQYLRSRSPSKPSKGKGKAGPAPGGSAALEDQPLAALLRVLCTMSHHHAAVRAAGVGAIEALAEEGCCEGAGALLGEDGLGHQQLQAILQAVAAQRAAIEADAEAFESLVVRALGGVPAAAAKKGRAGGSGGRLRGGQVQGAGDREQWRPLSLELAPAEAQALGTLLLALLPAQCGAAGLHAVALALRCLPDAVPPGALLAAGWQLLRGLVAPAEAAGPGARAGAGARRALGQQELQVVAEILSLFTPAAVTELLASDPAQGAAALQALLGMLTPAQQGAVGGAEVRHAALRALGADLYAVVPKAFQKEALVGLLQSASRDPSDACRAAARAALSVLPLGPSVLCPLLDATVSPGATPSQQEATPAAKRRRPRGWVPPSPAAQQAAQQVGEGGSAAPQVDASKLELCVLALELLQWKDNLSEPLALVPPIQATLAALLAAVEEAAATAAPALPPGSYAMQLALGALLGLVQRAQRAGQGALGASALDLALAVRCAQGAPDAALRNTALGLVGALAAAAPAAVLAHILDVVGVVGRSAAMQADAHSNKIASQVLSAVVPVWVAGGGSIQEVVAEVVAAAPRIPAQRRLAVFVALVDSLPKVEGLCATSAALLEQALAGVQAEGEEAGVATWSTELASALLAKASPAVQAATLAALLQHSLQAAEGNPTAPLPLLATAFATQQLQAAAGRAGKGPGAAATAESAAAEEGYEGLLQAALVQLQRAGELAAVEARRLEKKGERRRSGRAVEKIRGASEGTYKLLQALQRVMAPAAYVSSLAVLVTSPLDKVRRRALSLLISSLKAASEAAEGEGAEGEGSRGLQEAALGAVQPAVQLLHGPLPEGHEAATAITQQTALAALGALASTVGSSSPQPFLSALPAVLAAAQSDRSAVRGSALACVACVARALGPRLIPALPAVVRGVLAAAQAAAAAVGGPASAAAVPSATQDVGASSEEEGEGEGQPGSKPQRVGEAAALELAASLAAISALVDSLGAFLAPHLPAMLGVLLAPAVLRCQAARCADAAAAVRERVAEALAPRLLVGPLLGQLDAAVEAGAPAVCALLGMLTSALGHMDATATAAHHEAVFAFLLRALDLRRRRPASLAAWGAVDEVEAAAVGALVALTLKLSEAQFKPLFLRLLDWAGAAAPAHATSAGGEAAARTARGLALATLADALTERLRSVFVPYYRYLLDPFLEYLAVGSSAAPPKKKSKKKQKAEATEAPAGGVDSDPLAAENDWRLRLKVVRALHRCLLYDTVKFLDEPRFERLLPPLVAHLGLRPPPEVAEALAAEGEDALEAGLQLGEAARELDVLGRATVGCLVQLGVTAGSDPLWKRLNYQVLMASRSLDARTRLLALEAAAALAGRLQEEYLVLLPETLPFLAELLEDAEVGVEARAAEVLRSLEELSGESLAEYLKA